MIYDTLDVVELRDRFLQQVIVPTFKRYPHELGKERTIRYCLKNKDNHFFERVLGRKVDKGRLGSLFTLLFKKHYCELLYLFHTARKTYKMHDEKVFLLVVYKDLNIIFIMGDSNNYRGQHWDLVPITVLTSNDNFKYHYRIDIQE